MEANRGVANIIHNNRFILRTFGIKKKKKLEKKQQTDMPDSYGKWVKFTFKRWLIELNKLHLISIMSIIIIKTVK